MNSAGSHSDWVSGTAGAATGVGILTLALFPLAIPILALTIVTMLLLVIPLIAIAAIAAILIGAWHGIRAAGRGIRRPPKRRKPLHWSGFRAMGATGLEPVTSSLSSWRSPN